jgi:phosphoglycolate phosphatase
MLRELMNELSVSEGEVLMIGDTSHDLEMARAAGVDALAVTYGAHGEADLRACSPLECFSSVEALDAWLTANG